MIRQLIRRTRSTHTRKLSHHTQFVPQKGSDHLFVFRGIDRYVLYTVAKLADPSFFRETAGL